MKQTPYEAHIERQFQAELARTREEGRLHAKKLAARAKWFKIVDDAADYEAHQQHRMTVTCNICGAVYSLEHIRFVGPRWHGRLRRHN